MNEAKEQAIRDLDLRTCLERYGVSFNTSGAAYCPFHNERTASFRVRGRFWHCFGCGESGELIKFVRKRFNLGYGEALDVICRDFGINTARPSSVDLENIRRLQSEKQNAARQYQTLLTDLDLQTKVYLLANDVLEYVIDFGGGKSTENEKYVSAHFALMDAQRKLEQLEYEVAQFAKDHPEAVRSLGRKRSEPNTWR